MPFDFHADAMAGRDVAKALGFDPHGMVEINLKFRAGDLLVVTTEQLVPAEKLPKVIGEIVKRKYIVNCVAEPLVPRHDAATCCGERQVTECRPTDARADETSQATYKAGWSAKQRREWLQGEIERIKEKYKPVEPDVGEGWRDVRTGENAEHLADGDWVQDADGFWEPISRFMWNGFGCPCKRYRRRVTPVAEAKAKVLPLYADGAWAEIRSAQSNAMLVAALRAEVERLRLSDQERKAIAFFNNAWALEMWKPHGETLRKLLDRLRGGE